MQLASPFRLAAVTLALLGSAALAQAETIIYQDPHPDLVAIEGSVSYDGWNQLNRAGLGCADSSCSTARLVEGITANTWTSGDAVLQRTAGSLYPAGFGLYGDGVLTLTDSTVAGGIDTLVFQGVINNFAGAPFGLTLSVNGGSQALVADDILFVDTGLVADRYTYTWNLGGLEPITAYTLTLELGFAQVLALQVDQVSAVPEAGTAATLLAGLGAMGFMLRRRRP